jgi:hypothetical protein
MWSSLSQEFLTRHLAILHAQATIIGLRSMTQASTNAKRDTDALRIDEKHSRPYYTRGQEEVLEYPK